MKFMINNLIKIVFNLLKSLNQTKNLHHSKATKRHISMAISSALN